MQYLMKYPSSACRVFHFVVALLAAVTLLVRTGAQATADESDAAPRFPPELVDFVPYDKNPVFKPAGAGHWDVKIRERGWIMREGDRYLLWYTGYNGKRAGWKALGLATSPDGLAWTRYPQNPIYDEHWTEDMMVVKSADTFFMFSESIRYGRAYPFAGQFYEQPQLLTSPDGIRWQRRGALRYRNAAGEPLDEVSGTPTAYRENNTWYLFYEKRDVGIWLARSDDGLNWQNVQDEPVLTLGPGTYDNRLMAMNQIVKYQGRYYGYYHGQGDDDPTGWHTCVAVSDDMRSWQKYPGNPIVKGNKSSGILVPDGDRFRLYTMHDQVDVYFPRVEATK